MDRPYIFRIGKISSINYENGTARITYEDKDKSTTAEFSFLAWQYWMPEVGEQVIVGHLSNGTGAAVILGPVWHNEHRPVEGFEGLYRKEYYKKPGKAYERYDANEECYSQDITGTVEIRVSEKWTVRVGDGFLEIDKNGNCNQSVARNMDSGAKETWSAHVNENIIRINQDGSISLNASSGVTINAPAINLIGNIQISGSATVGGNLSVAGEIMAAETVTAQGDVTAGGISLQNHTHTCPATQSSTSKPN